MSHLISIDEATSARLVNDMNTFGFATLEDALTPGSLKDLRDYVERQAARHNNQYFAYHGFQALADSGLAVLGKATEFKAALAHMHRLGRGHDANSDEVFPVLRCVQGGSGRKESNSFHFDATLLTMLIPIYTPDQGEERGDLMLFPNLRRVRNNVMLNIAEKVFFQNAATRKLVCLGIKHKWLKPTVLRIVPGNAYFFWGYRSLHANQACNPAFRRATALFHFGDPHAGSMATWLILKLNQYRARKAVANTHTPLS
jgi:hypothetical protein